MSGMVYFGAYDSTFYCLNATTGKLVFGTEIGDDIYSSPAVRATGAFVGCDDGLLYCLDPYNGNVLWSNVSAGTGLQSSPALAGDLVAYCDTEGLKVLSSLDGRPNASFRFGDASDCSPAVEGNLIIWADSLGLVRAVGPYRAPMDHADGPEGQLALVLFVLIGLNAVFFAVILIALRRMRKRYNRTRGLWMEKEHKGGR
jgi:hypothetical protein